MMPACGVPSSSRLGPYHSGVVALCAAQGTTVVGLRSSISNAAYGRAEDSVDLRQGTEATSRNDGF
jgi:hypothetical protein